MKATNLRVLIMFMHTLMWLVILDVNKSELTQNPMEWYVHSNSVHGFTNLCCLYIFLILVPGYLETSLTETVSCRASIHWWGHRQCQPEFQPPRHWCHYCPTSCSLLSPLVQLHCLHNYRFYSNWEALPESPNLVTHLIWPNHRDKDSD